MKVTDHITVSGTNIRPTPLKREHECYKPIRLLIKTVVTKPYDYLGTLFDPVNTSISTHSVLT